MAPPDAAAQRHDAENREAYAARRLEEAMLAEEREMEAEMRSFEEDEAQTKRRIAEEWRKEHWGHDPERPPDWTAHPGSAL
jgi:hypothetical protein